MAVFRYNDVKVHATTKSKESSCIIVLVSLLQSTSTMDEAHDTATLLISTTPSHVDKRQLFSVILICCQCLLYCNEFTLLERGPCVHVIG